MLNLNHKSPTLGAETLKKDKKTKRVRITLATIAVAATLILGGINPNAVPMQFYNALIIAFCLSVSVAFATGIVLIPAPRDPRIPRRYRDQDDDDDDSSERQSERFTGYSHPVFTRPLPEPKDR